MSSIAPIETIDAGPVLIVGAGLAGLFAALRLKVKPVTVLASAPLGAGASSIWAQGGIAAPIGKDDNAELHIADTIAAGAGLVDPAIARILSEEAPLRIDDLIRLGVPMAERLGVVQGGLDNSGQDSDAVADLVDRLVARFGRDRVLRFTARDTHDPARAARRVPADAMPAQHVPWPVPVPGAPPTRPTHLFDPPQPIETLAEVPDGPPARFRWRQAMHEVTRSEGPERIAPEWWRPGAGTATRDYFRVEDTQGRRFWVFREGLYDRETDQPRWFLHGLFP